ncbi:MAG TPA: hydrogenase iron-sulfur subunit, partial [bacterium]|nr:hydrogenase iron-sulfur subunit [bacterium]
PGDCHYQAGNHKALRRYTLLKRLLKMMGIEEERVRLEWISASEGDKVQRVINEMTEDIRRLGPLNLPPIPQAGRMPGEGWETVSSIGQEAGS